MKYGYLTYLIVLLNICFTQSKSDKNGIIFVKKNYKLINNSLDTLEKQKIDDVIDLIDLDSYDDIFIRLGNVKFEKYVYRDFLAKIILTFDGLYNELVMEYYYKRNKLFFVYQRRKKYERERWYDNVKYKILENRYYFRTNFHDNSSMIKWLNKDKIEVNKISKDFLLKELTLLKDSHLLLILNAECYTN